MAAKIEKKLSNLESISLGVGNLFFY